MIKIINFLFVVMLGLLFWGATCAQAQDVSKIALTITPPLIKTNIKPGGIWSGEIKIVNNNPTSIDIYIQLADFVSKEEGGVDFKFKNQESSDAEAKEIEPFSLYRWINIDRGPIEIGAQQSKSIPFVIKAPDNAEPGGHYGAILAGTKPPEKIEGSAIKISSLLASLLMVDVLGDVREEGNIREFSTDKSFYQSPEVNLTMRFANLGNIHLQPAGEIKIYNYFGKERGKIKINHQTEFGNVLPKSIRKYNYTWQGEKSLLEMGRYKAELILTYGSKAKQQASSTVYFWVVDLSIVLPIAGSILVLIVLLIFGIKLYVRRSIVNLQKQIVSQKPIEQPAVQKPIPATTKTTSVLREPVKKEPSKTIDLRNSMEKNKKNNT